ncbi:Fe2+/Zn2+ uptake regulation protein [Frankia canadensis]|uniref:Fe2+/Zn2+ uptake regulation protein n=1 Tax=Frankia canadensis TaxID=1836972 RepID=A0A2I2L2F4_9ACTN|nr:Fur family transcriptional regulator [Frankia canadensis]SNQ52047.1 Fe2+/Zn2+ uptake regulation protein [Frankia canadensis]SOU59337.1 Fe2+/Zn2+ uptake regulation protein [Frankia canadensis]
MPDQGPGSAQRTAAGGRRGEEDNALVAAGIARLRARGERVTPARRAVLRVLAETSEHLSAEEVLARADEIVPGMHRTTVYRAVESLGEVGLITHVHPAHGPAVYHLAAALTGGAHLHTRCRRCGEIADVPADLLDDVAARLAATVGFRLQPDHAALTGLCRSCADARAAGDGGAAAPA